MPTARLLSHFSTTTRLKKTSQNSKHRTCKASKGVPKSFKQCSKGPKLYRNIDLHQSDYH